MTYEARYDKNLLVLRTILIGADYNEALVALEYARHLHCGLRKNGLSPAFSHQVEIALYALTLPLEHNEDREALLAVICLHDAREDHGISDGEIRDLFTRPGFADKVAPAVDAMTKKFRGITIDADQVFAAIAANMLASLAKGCDRIHNLQSMVGVFGIEKQKSYIAEVKDRFLPMLKLARRSFPRATMAYENIKHIMLSQIELIEAMHDAINKSV